MIINLLWTSLRALTPDGINNLRERVHSQRKEKKREIYKLKRYTPTVSFRDPSVCNPPAAGDSPPTPAKINEELFRGDCKNQ
jgi:hypothetical protein